MFKFGFCLSLLILAVSCIGHPDLTATSETRSAEATASMKRSERLAATAQASQTATADRRTAIALIPKPTPVPKRLPRSTDRNIREITQEVDVIALWSDIYVDDVVRCVQSGRLPNPQTYVDAMTTFGEIAGSVDIDLRDGVLDQWELSDIREVVDTIKEVITDINYRCDLRWR